MEIRDDHKDDGSINFLPVITNFGNEEVYLKLSQEIERCLPLKPYRWKREGESTINTVCLKASLETFSTERLTGTVDGFVTKRPLLHLYWITCSENRDYRHGTKQKIEHWKNHLQSCNINDWLIIYVKKQSRRRMTRSKDVVYENLKADFGDEDGTIRVTQLWEPSKAVDTCWEALMERIRRLLWSSIKNHLVTVDDRLQEHKQRHLEPTWSFLEYLQLSEEVAGIYNFAAHYQESFACYEELNSFISQLLSQQDHNGNPSVMRHWTRTPFCWDGISLRDEAILYHRDVVYGGKASILELKNYISIRQWQLLLSMGKRLEVPSNFLMFLLTTVNETKLLLTGLSVCVPACWVVSSCLEYVSCIGEEEMSDNTVVSYLAQLFDYAREKLYSIGEECHLLPGKQPVVDMLKELSSGLCISQHVPEDTETGSKMLMATINSQEIFSKRYIALCGKSKRFYENCRRFRCAKRVSLDMARYYYMLEKYGFAVNELMATLNEYRLSGWEILHNNVMELLTRCHPDGKSLDLFLSTLGHLSCTKILSVEKRLSYADMFLTNSYQKTDCVLSIGLTPVINIEHVWIELSGGQIHIGEIVNVFVTLQNNMLRDINVEEIEIEAKCTKAKKSRSSKNCAVTSNLPTTASETVWTELLATERKSSSVSVKRSQSEQGKSQDNEAQDNVKYEFETEVQQSETEGTNSGSESSIEDDSKHDELEITQSGCSESQVDEASEKGRMDNSVSEMEDSTPIVVEDERGSTLVSGPKILKVGENIIKLTAKMERIGKYNLHDLRCKIGNTVLCEQLALPRESNSFLVVADPPKFSWTSNLPTECGVLGIKQRMRMTVANGPGFIPNLSTVHLSSSSGLEFSSLHQSSVIVRSRNQTTYETERAITIVVDSSKSNDAVIYLPECRPFEDIELYFDVTTLKPSQDLEYGYTQKHKVELTCLWLSELTNAKATLECTFGKPFNVEHQRMFSNAGNYICTRLKNPNAFPIDIFEPAVQGPNSKNISFNCTSQQKQMEIPAEGDLSIIWSIVDKNDEYEPCPKLKCRLNVKFKTKDQDETGNFSECFDIAYAKPLFGVNTFIKARENGCLVQGMSYSMEVIIANMNKLPRSYLNGKLFYKLVKSEQWEFDDDECRKLEIRDEYCHFSFTTSVTPCQSGQLRHPEVSLSKKLDESMEIRKFRSRSSLKGLSLSSSRRTSAILSDGVDMPFSSGEIVNTECAKILKVICNNTETPNPESPINQYGIDEGVIDAVVLETISSTERQRQNHIHELINTERNYIYDLKATLEAFYKPMAVADILSENELSTVFINLKEVVFCNMKLLEALMKRKAMSTDNVVEAIGDILVEQIPRFTPYLEFCSCQMKSCKFVQRKSKTVEFDEFERKCTVDKRLRQKLPLNSYLAKPMQRITKYPLIIKQIIKYTPEDHSDRGNLEQALSKSEELCSKVNENNRLIESLSMLNWLQVHVDLQGLGETLVFNSETKYVGQRTCLHHVSLYVQGSNEELRAFLFNDFLLLTIYDVVGRIDTDLTENSEAETKPDCFIYDKPILLDKSLVVKLAVASEVEDTLFCLISNGVTHELRAESKNERNMLLTKLKVARALFIEKERLKVAEQGLTNVPFTISDGMSKITLIVVEGFCMDGDNSADKSDFYCQVRLGQEQHHRTPVMFSTSNPKWLSKMEFYVQNREDEILELQVFSRNFFSPDDFFGSIAISVSNVLENGPCTKKLFFHQKKVGGIVVRASLNST